MVRKWGASVDDQIFGWVKTQHRLSARNERLAQYHPFPDIRIRVERGAKLRLDRASFGRIYGPVRVQPIVRNERVENLRYVERSEFESDAGNRRALQQLRDRADPVATDCR